MFSPCSGDVFIRVFTVISWRDHWQTRVHNMRQFYTGGGREPVIIFWWLLWFWCGHSAVTPDQSPRLHFKSVCHEHHQVTLTWNQRCVTSVTWMGSTWGSFPCFEKLEHIYGQQGYWSFLCSRTGCCSWQLKLGWALLAWRHGLLDHQDDKLVKPQFDVNPTEESGSWISRFIHGLDCKSSESDWLVCCLFMISLEDMFNANDNDKKIKVCVTQVWHFVTLEENYFNNFSIKWHLWHHMYNIVP